MTYPCAMQERPAQAALVVRRRAPLAQLAAVLGPAWGEIMTQAAAQGASPAGPPFVAYHNMDWQNLDLEIGMPFATALRGTGDVQATTLPAGPAAVCAYTGPYDRIGAAHDALQQWLVAQSRQALGPAYEFYLNDPATTAPAALRTDVLQMVR
ncbi:MAG: GyrI-like domain-containing protein [Gemmatimonadaceae bacterium]|nr:GyrI-like domain-containing protein [Gemmatimonadota bacterium]